MQRLTASLHAGERLERFFVQAPQQTAINSQATADIPLRNVFDNVLMRWHDNTVRSGRARIFEGFCDTESTERVDTPPTSEPRGKSRILKRILGFESVLVAGGNWGPSSGSVVSSAARKRLDALDPTT